MSHGGRERNELKPYLDTFSLECQRGAHRPHREVVSSSRNDFFIDEPNVMKLSKELVALVLMEPGHCNPERGGAMRADHGFLWIHELRLVAAGLEDGNKLGQSE